MTSVPVFLYHAVTDNPPAWIAPFTVRPARFAAQLDRLTAAGRTVIPLAELVAAMRHGTSLPSRPAVLTFDDGFADFWRSVYPQLATRGFPATLYITTGAVRTPGGSAGESLLPPADMLSWRQIRTLDVAGVEIGGHSRTHPQLDTFPRRKLVDEIVGCRETLENELGHRVSTFAYPHGYSDARVRRDVHAAGWGSACEVGNAFSSPRDNPFRISRLTVRADTPIGVFQDWVDGRGARTAPFRERPRTRAWRLYRRARSRLGTPVGGPPSEPRRSLSEAGGRS
ncbi:polysaccharide deacetylase family protein [Streptomyces sp. NPDC015242]|uniref:polysaccharide deacetylase family protein n=1 Tax=Streptomyces sp. NPDC015242 TaxID=3364951 RepID=UPI0036F8B54A